MSQDGLVGIRAIAGYIGVGQAIGRVTITCFDSIELCLLDWKAKAGMVEADHCPDAGEVHAARIKHRAGGVGCQSHGLNGTVEIEDRAGFALWAQGMDALAGMQAVVHGTRPAPQGAARRWDRWGRSDGNTWGGWRWLGEIGSACAWDHVFMHSM